MDLTTAAVALASTGVLALLIGCLLGATWEHERAKLAAILAEGDPGDTGAVASSGDETPPDDWYETHVRGIAQAMYGTDCLAHQVGGPTSDTTFERLPAASVEALERHARAALGYIDAHMPRAYDQEATP